MIDISGNEIQDFLPISKETERKEEMRPPWSSYTNTYMFLELVTTYKPPTLREYKKGITVSPLLSSKKKREVVEMCVTV